MRILAFVLCACVACDRPATKSVAPSASMSAPVASASAPLVDASVAATPSVDAGLEGTWGDATILTVTGPGRPVRLDGPAPSRKFVLRSKVDPTRIVATGRLDGDYRPVAYAVQSHVYVMLYLGQTGAWYGIRDIALLDEEGKLRENVVSRELFAVTDVESKDGEYVALVGKINDSRGATNFRLLVFDVATAHVRDVGPAPQGPPGEPEFCTGNGWVEPSGIAGYQPMDEGILSFESDTLVVSKGADSCKGRAKKRDATRYSLKSPSLGSKSGGKL